jgi:processive 1,2-diacylglycerol beta-glucosyltransferase
MLGRGRQTGTSPGCDVLILMASYGAGHRQAARAIGEALRDARPELSIATADYVDLVSPAFNRVTQSAYVLSVKYVPAAFGWFYHGTSRIGPRSGFQRYLNSLGRRRVLRLLDLRQPRVVVCTFPTQAGVISELVGRGAVRVPTVTIITDNTIHSQWIHPHTDEYCVSAEEIAAGVVSRGIPAARVHTTGIPIRPVFRQRFDRAETLRRLDLDPERPTVLVMSGAFGMLTGVVAACRALLSLPQTPQIVLVTGRDRKLAEDVRLALGGPDRPLRVLGFVDEIAPLMQATDVLVTKAGGLTTSEALASRLPMVIYKPIPGQEQANTAFLTRHGAARSVRTARQLAATVRELLGQPERLDAMRAACERLGRPDAAAAVAEVVLATLERASASPHEPVVKPDALRPRRRFHQTIAAHKPGA